MKVVTRLMSLFTGRLDGFSQVNTDLTPLYPGTLSYEFPVREDVMMEVVFREVHPRPEKPFAQERNYKAPSKGSVMNAVQEMYGMIAMGGSVLFPGDAVEPSVGGDDAPEGFEQAVWDSGFALSDRERAVALHFWKGGAGA